MAGSKVISVGDFRKGSNQVNNEPGAAAKIAALTASGCYLPRGLTVVPTSGPECFQNMFVVSAPG